MKNKIILCAVLCLSVFIARATDSITGTYKVCVGAGTAMAGTGSGAWSSDNDAIATVDPASGALTGVSAGTAVISFGTASTIVTVNALPDPITGSATVCTSAHNTLHSATAGGTWSSSNTGIVTGTGSGTSGTISGVAAGSATITYALSTGCIATAMATVIASVSPITGSADLCSGYTQVYSDASPGGVWSVVTGGAYVSIDASGNATAITGISGNFGATITYTVASGTCKTTKAITTHPTPPALSPLSPDNGTACVGATTTINGVNHAFNPVWSSDNTAIATVAPVNGGPNAHQGRVTGVSAGTVTISYTLTASGCATSYVVTINAIPTITGSKTVCTGSTSALGASVPGGTWGSTNTGVATVGSATGVVTGVATGMATISYFPSTGCSTAVVVTVVASPGAITGTMLVCEGGSATTLSCSPSGGTWSSSNTDIATVGTDGVVTSGANGVVTITYTAANGCYATTEVTVSPNGGPVNTQGIPNVHDFCVGNNNTLSGVGGPIGAGPYWASSDDAVISITDYGYITTLTTGVATLSYTRGNGCYATYTITVHAMPAEIDGGDRTVCQGDQVIFTDAVTEGTWASSNNTKALITDPISGVVDFNLHATGTVNIIYTMYGYSVGCSVSITVTVEVCEEKAGGHAGGENSIVASMQGGQYSISPNPINGAIHIVQKTAANISEGVSIVDMAGAVVYKGTVTFANGTGSIRADKLAPGMYILQVSNAGSGVSKLKLFVEK